MNASNLFGRGVGRKKLEAVVAVYPEVLTGVVPKGDLRVVEGIRPDNVQLILDALPAFYALAKSIDKELCGKKAPTPAPSTADAALEPLRGKTIVFTGFREKEWEAQLKTVECSVAGTVSKKVTMVVAADVEETSSKLEKARALGIPIVSKAAFAKKFARI
jgi:NAD-dependent DNA ligase